MKRFKYKLPVESDGEIIPGTEIEKTCADSDLATMKVIAGSEAYNGEYTVEEIPDPPHEPDVWDEMAEAYQRGVQRA